ncbi:MAG: HigA family addiction module antitoxin [Planctomycetota bacterium]
MAKKKDLVYEPDYVVPPGDTLQEMLEARGMVPADLAKLTGLTTEALDEILGGRAPITPATASSLESVFGVPAGFWINLQRNFETDSARLRKTEAKATKNKAAVQFVVTDDAGSHRARLPRAPLSTRGRV